MFDNLVTAQEWRRANGMRGLPNTDYPQHC
jgi:hypothetical protein